MKLLILVVHLYTVPQMVAKQERRSWQTEMKASLQWIPTVAGFRIMFLVLILFLCFHVVDGLFTVRKVIGRVILQKRKQPQSKHSRSSANIRRRSSQDSPAAKKIRRSPFVSPAGKHAATLGPVHATRMNPTNAVAQAALPGVGRAARALPKTNGRGYQQNVKDSLIHCLFFLTSDYLFIVSAFVVFAYL